LKSKKADEVASKLESFIEKIGKKNITFFSDHGSEFKALCIKVFKKYNVKHFTGSNELIKASLAEMRIKHLRRIIWQYIIDTNNVRYIDKLQYLVNILNHRKNSRNNLAPKDITQMDVPYLFEQKHNFRNRVSKAKFKINDFVQVLKLNKKLGSKQASQKFTNEYFRVTKIYYHNPIQYGLHDILGEKIKGKWYEPELILKQINKNTKYSFRILKQNKNEIFIEYLGWPKKFNTWIKKDKTCKV
jgi:hypothetical protein